ncbi:hypothetical protein TH61_15145 [Rufibacter sp. DG15C]|nr:hypothetical protein TH61_15145 [Rufibacter sp. DG15C]
MTLINAILTLILSRISSPFEGGRGMTEVLVEQNPSAIEELKLILRISLSGLVIILQPPSKRDEMRVITFTY